MGQWAGALGGAALLASTFLAWYGHGGAEANAWEAFGVTDLLLALAAIAGLGVGIVSASGASASYPLAGSAIAAGLGIVALALVAFRLADPPYDGDVDRLAGAWIALGASAAIVFGGVWGMKEEPAPAAGRAGH